MAQSTIEENLPVLRIDDKAFLKELNSLFMPSQKVQRSTKLFKIFNTVRIQQMALFKKL
jgi:hypothetical protein